jgi:hypothetical protein
VFTGDHDGEVECVVPIEPWGSCGHLGPALHPALSRARVCYPLTRRW